MLLCLSLAAVLVACAASSGGEPDPADETKEPEPISGGWSTGEPTELSDDQRAIFNRAMEGYAGANYTPLRYLGMQVVGGYNHRILCKAQAVAPDAPESYAIVEIFEDPEGNAEITSTIEISEAEAAKYFG